MAEADAERRESDGAEDLQAPAAATHRLLLLRPPPPPRALGLARRSWMRDAFSSCCLLDSRRRAFRGKQINEKNIFYRYLPSWVVLITHHAEIKILDWSLTDRRDAACHDVCLASKVSSCFCQLQRNLAKLGGERAKERVTGTTKAGFGTKIKQISSEISNIFRD